MPMKPLLLTLVFHGVVPAQSETPQFEVASIRETVNGVRVLGEFSSSGSRVEYYGFGIPALIAEAWKVRGDQVVLSPGVSRDAVIPMMAAGRSARIYEIAALAPQGATPTRDEFRLMLQSLLATRFKLATHTEKRDLSVYVLETNGTPKLKPSSGDGSCRAVARRTPEGQKIVATHCPIQTLMNNLFVDRPIYDETELTGFYDFESTAALPFQTNDPLATTPFSAVKELGLRLEAKRVSVDTIVIDHIEAPGEN
jgi:uncharacterized protein (TIGR03435 family)